MILVLILRIEAKILRVTGARLILKVALKTCLFEDRGLGIRLKSGSILEVLRFIPLVMKFLKVSLKISLRAGFRIGIEIGLWSDIGLLLVTGKFLLVTERLISIFRSYITFIFVKVAFFRDKQLFLLRSLIRKYLLKKAQRNNREE